jgi:capsular exopolysaccharide synthesis family protein
MAISFAQAGHKTLLIDCDLRKTVQHKYFGIDRKPGLTDYLFGEVKLEAAIRDSGIPNLSVITSGQTSNNPAELLASKKMKELLESLKLEYDFILVDTPPILVCSDSRILAETADGMILIVRVESTNIKALDHAINLTKHLNIDILGVILNQVRFRYGRGYYYAYRYYKPYSYYSGYYYKRQYYDYAESETGERIKVRKSSKRKNVPIHPDEV